MTWHRARPAAALAVGLLLLASSSAHAERVVVGGQRIDLTAAAHPHAADQPIVDHVFRTDTVYWGGSDAATTATASAICAGCSGEAVSLEVLYVGRADGMTLDNAAIAWTQECEGCVATAVSLQIAVVTGAPTLTPNNRALAVNAGCRVCRATSAAYQLVVAGTSPQAQLSPTTLHALRRWANGRAEALRRSPSGAPARTRLQQQHALAGLADVVNAELGSRTVTAGARLSRR